ncbi:uncharacterized protein [Rhodnius prolixus]|uniref:uncharacterized protein n=1 Tax=Rhodnius prolixus TaxID=13249 RepID=UPI003D18D01E
MDYRYIDWDELLNRNQPCLFKSIDGHPISFHFCIDNVSLKQKLEELVTRNGGDSVEKYFEMTPMSALMVDEKSFRNFYNRVSFRTSYVIECVRSGYLHDINEYIHNDEPTSRRFDYMDVIFFRKHKFYEEKSCFCCRHSSVIKGNKKEFQENGTANNADCRCSSSCKQSTACKEQCISLPTLRTEIENVRKTVPTRTLEKCLNPCSHCYLQLDQSRRTISSHKPSGKRSFVVSTEERCDPLNEEKLDRRKYCSTCNCQPSAENDNETHSLVPDSEQVNLHNSPDCGSNSEGFAEERASRLSANNSDNDSDIPKRGRIRNVVVSDDDEDDVDDERNAECVKNTNHRALPEDEDDIGPSMSTTSTKLQIPDKHTRKLYSRKEKEAILKYIIKHDAVEHVKGIVIWKKMEKSNICPNRTWMSMQNHFKKSLCKELDQFAFLTPSQKKSLRI